ncbi:15033_t:CDS:2 [Entrophospora sp. SA101]|nr:15033_t:CDS:2 [Entrophospora sp. SA101]
MTSNNKKKKSSKLKKKVLKEIDDKENYFKLEDRAVSLKAV